MRFTLPDFMYASPEYIAFVFDKSGFSCTCCNRVRGYHYVTSFYNAGENEVVLCPWCISDGRAAKKYHARFNVLSNEKKLHPDIVTEVCERTPGIIAWQDQVWPVHCNDACVYLGDASSVDVAEASDETRQHWMEDYGQDEESWHYLRINYQPGGDQGMYKFLCRHCGLVIFNWDFF